MRSSANTRRTSKGSPIVLEYKCVPVFCLCQLVVQSLKMFFKKGFLVVVYLGRSFVFIKKEAVQKTASLWMHEIETTSLLSKSILFFLYFLFVLDKEQ
jgi:hypothetical protein